MIRQTRDYQGTQGIATCTADNYTTAICCESYIEEVEEEPIHDEYPFCVPVDEGLNWDKIYMGLINEPP